MTETTVQDVAGAYTQWVGVAASGWSGRAAVVVEHLVSCSATQTAAGVTI